jgi:hypothetical protein
VRRVWGIGGRLRRLASLRSTREAPAPSAPPPLVEEPSRWTAFYRELSRARRHERPFSLVKMPVDRVVEALPDSAADALDEPQRAARATEQLRQSLRLTDEVWVDGPHAFVLMPEAEPEDVSVALPRAVDGQPLDDAEVCVASFPRDGVTSGAVLASLLREDEETAEVASIGALDDPDVTDTDAPGGQKAG